MDLTPIAPSVSIATGVKEWPWSRLLYLDIFLSSANAATPPVWLVATSQYEGANVSETVASQTSGFPFFQGTIVTPSGLFPSERVRPDGSSLHGIRAINL